MNAKTLNPSYVLLGLLLVADLIFIVLYALYGFHLLADPKFGLIEDWSYGEVYQYIKELWIVLLLACLAVYATKRGQKLVFAIWALVFVYLLLDDSAQIHERLGAALAEAGHVPPMFGLRAVDFGELAVTAVAGLLPLAALGLAFKFAHPLTRRFSIRLFGLLGALIFFGVGLDVINIDEPRLLGKAISAVEDGGEQVVMSVIVWFVFSSLVTPSLTPPDENQVSSARRKQSGIEREVCTQ